MEQTNMVSTEKMILTDTSLSENQGKDNRKRRKKGAKKKDVLASDDLIQHPEDGTCLETDTGLSNNINVSSSDECSMVKTNNILVEDVNRVPGSAVNLVSTIVESDGQVCSNNGSTGKGLSELLTEEKKKRKRKKGQNNLNNLRSNDVEYDRIDVPSIPNSAIENNSIRQATTSTSLVEHPLCNDLIHQPAVDTCLMKSDDNNKGSKGNHTKMDAKSSKSNIEVNVEPTFKVSGAYNPAGVDDVSGKSPMVLLQQQKPKRKKKKKNLNALTGNQIMPIPCLMADSKMVQHNMEEGIPEEIHQNESATKDENCSGKDSIGLVDTQNNSISNAIPVSEGKNISNMQGGEKRKRKTPMKNLNLESKDGRMTSTDLSGEHQDKPAKLNANSTPEAIVKPICKVAEDDLACTDNVFGNMAMVPLQPQKTKGKKKKKKKNASATNPLAPSTGIIADSELLQHDSDPGIPQEIHQKNAEDDMACTDNDSGNMAMVPLQPHKTKRKKIKKKMNASTTNLLAPSTGIIADSELFQHDSDLGIPQEIQQKNAEDDMACTDNDSGNMAMVPLQPHKTKRKKKNKKMKMNVSTTNLLAPSTGIIADSELFQHDSDLGIPQEIHQKNAEDDLACTDNISGNMVMVPLQPQKTKRKKKKMNVSATNPLAPGTGIIADIELLQHDSDLGIPQEIHQDECATRDEYCSDKNSSGVISSETNSEPNVSSVSQGKALGNQKVEKKRKRQSQGTNLNLETKEGVISSTDVTGEQQLKAAKLDSDQNAAIGRTLTDCVRKKLLVLDLNGLLADVVEEKTGNFKADGIVSGKKVFKRPFCEDFLQFCFERFTVGVWSSRKKRNVDMVIDLTMGGKNRSRLAFIWDQSHCMQTGFKTIENREKPLFLKRLSQLWKNINKKLSGELEGYDKSNTLLLDDSPYKALQNPPYTAIFPKPYQYRDRNDNALGPGGDLRVYLEGLASAGDVQEYIKHNPFGQKAITESDPSWSFYVKVINYGSVDHNTSTPKETQSHLQPTELLQA